MTDIPEPTETDLKQCLRVLYSHYWDIGLADGLIRRCHAAERKAAALTAEISVLKAALEVVGSVDGTVETDEYYTFPM